MLEDFIEANNLKAEIIKSAKRLGSEQAAAAFLGIDLERFVKTKLFIDKKGLPMLSVWPADKKLDAEKLCKAAGTEALDEAGGAEVMDITGYEEGAVPPISVYGVRTVVDRAVMENEKVYCFAGDESRILEISPAEIEGNAEGFVVADIAEQKTEGKIIQ